VFLAKDSVLHKNFLAQLPHVFGRHLFGSGFDRSRELIFGHIAEFSGGRENADAFTHRRISS
jgi:hypothetical protein